MADGVNNIPPSSGDILGGMSSNRSSNNDLSQSVDNIEKLLIQLVRDNSDRSRSAFETSPRSSGYSAKNRSKRSSSNRNISNSNMKSLFGNYAKEGMLDQVLDGLEEEFLDYIGLPSITEDVKKQINQAKNILAKQLADAIGTPVEKLPKTLAKQLLKQTVLKKLDSIPEFKKFKDSFSSQFNELKNSAISKVAVAWDNNLDKSAGGSSVRDVLKSDNIRNIINQARGKSSSGKSVSSGSSDDTQDSGSAISDAANAASGAADIVSKVADISSGSLDVGGLLNAVKGTIGDLSGGLLDDLPKLKEMGSTVADFVLPNLKSLGTGALESAPKLLSMGKDAAALAGPQLAALGSTAASTVGPALAGIASAAAPLLPIIAGVVVAAGLLTLAFGDLIGKGKDVAESFGNFVGAIGDAASKDESNRKKDAKLQTERLRKDVETYIRQPFKVLEEAANQVYNVWDSVLQTINGTQGYNKTQLQELMSSYSQRLRSEGLSSVVGSTDVTSMLESILKQGLSGKVAEEFAYITTVLNKAIPTEDFTSYASGYASIAAKYMEAGHSQTEALQYANDQLKIFASNTLNASRVVSGGLTTSLTGLSDVFNDIVKIAETGNTTNTSNLSSALSTILAVGGKVSPTVGSGLVDRIVEAAVGGNDSSLVALRSLAGTGASNTAFLKQLVNNPGSVLATLFENLGNMLDKSQDNYMEVAYSLADTFGVTADALVRVDWDELVNQLKNNSSSMSALNENLNNLASGETTTTAESEKLQQINQYMIDNGLSYVLDNEAAREIQQHMWDQEIAKQMQEAEYAVNLKGTALDLLASLVNFGKGILNFLTFNLVGGATGVANVLDTVDDLKGYEDGIKKFLEVGKVGSGNAQALSDLTNRDVNSLSTKPTALELLNSNKASHLSSSKAYSWSGNNSKSVLGTLSSIFSEPLTSLSSNSIFGTSTSATDAIKANTDKKLQDWLGTMSSSIKNHNSFDEWYKTASDYGFSDVGSALSDAGYSKSDIEGMYTDEVVNQASEYNSSRMAAEDAFWAAATNFYNSVWPTDYETWTTLYSTVTTNWSIQFATAMTTWQELYTLTMANFTQHLDDQFVVWTDLYTEKTTTTHDKLQYMNNQFDKNFVNDFLYEWKDYYIGNHTHYRAATNFDSSIRTINTEKNQTGKAVLALAQTLTKNYEDLADPTVQTNVLLGQIVILLQSILTAQQSGSGLTLPTALSALGLNVTSKQS